MNWLYLSLTALLLWGIWAFLIKLSSSYLDWRQIAIFSTLGATIPILALISIDRPQLYVKNKGLFYAILSGMAVALGSFMFFSAMGKGKASLIMPLTALYPLVTVILSLLILGERISVNQGMGILLALVAIALLSS